MGIDYDLYYLDNGIFVFVYDVLDGFEMEYFFVEGVYLLVGYWCVRDCVWSWVFYLDGNGLFGELVVDCIVVFYFVIED